jgi:hypothetical protein
LAAVIVFRNEPHQKFCQLVLDSGENVMLRMNESGLKIERMLDANGPAALLFQADVEMATSIAMGLTSLDQARRGKVLDVLVAMVMELGTSERVAAAFRDAAKAIR